MDRLHLSKFNILSISENEFDFLIQVVTNSPPSVCPHCGCIANLYKHNGTAIRFEPLAMAMKNWEEEIFAYFDHRVSDAYTESLNSLIRVINRLGRGYSFEALRAKILFTKELKKQRKPKYQRRFDSYDLQYATYWSCS